MLESKKVNEYVGEKECIERVKRIEEKIDAAILTISNSVDKLGSLVNIVISHHDKTLDRHEKVFGEQAEQMADINEQIASLLQWKADEYREQDATSKRNMLLTSVAVLVIGILSNIGKIVSVIQKYTQ